MNFDEMENFHEVDCTSIRFETLIRIFFRKKRGPVFLTSLWLKSCCEVPINWQKSSTKTVSVGVL